jgi:hypothetical protein
MNLHSATLSEIPCFTWDAGRVVTKFEHKFKSEFLNFSAPLQNHDPIPQQMQNLFHTD